MPEAMSGLFLIKGGTLFVKDTKKFQTENSGGRNVSKKPENRKVKQYL